MRVELGEIKSAEYGIRTVALFIRTEKAPKKLTWGTYLQAPVNCQFSL